MFTASVQSALAHCSSSWQSVKNYLSSLADRIATIFADCLSRSSAARPSGFVGIPALIEKHSEQLKLFEEWAQQKQFGEFHIHHYDWWMFPIDRDSSGQGAKYTLNAERIQALKTNPQFMHNYRRGVELLLQSWGWDLRESKPVALPSQNQSFDDHFVRLGKVLHSLELFGERELFLSVQKFAQSAVDPSALTGSMAYLSRWITPAQSLAPDILRPL